MVLTQYQNMMIIQIFMINYYIFQVICPVPIPEANITPPEEKNTLPEGEISIHEENSSFIILHQHHVFETSRNAFQAFQIFFSKHEIRLCQKFLSEILFYVSSFFGVTTCHVP